MSVKDIFSHNKKLSEKKFGRLYSKDARMKEVFSDKKIAGALDKTSERNEFYNMLKSKKENGVTKQEMKEALGEWMAGKGRTISRKEAYTIAKEFFGDERVKYIMPKKGTGSSSSTGSADFLSGSGEASQNLPQHFGSSGNIRSRATGSILGTQKSAAYSKASNTADAQNTKNPQKSAKKEAQSRARIKSISAGLAASIEMMGPMKSKDNKTTKRGDFFRAINATRRNIRG